MNTLDNDDCYAGDIFTVTDHHASSRPVFDAQARPPEAGTPTGASIIFRIRNGCSFILLEKVKQEPSMAYPGSLFFLWKILAFGTDIIGYFGWHQENPGIAKGIIKL